MIAAYTKTRELYTIDNTNRRLRVRSSWVTKRRTYITFPEFSMANTWRGASEIVREFHFNLDSAVSILNLFSEAPDNANFCPCIAWKPTSETIVRYKLWKDVGEILWVDDYTGEPIGADFSIEIWNTNNPIISGGGQTLYLSTLVIPTDFCDTSDVELTTDYDVCTDITFDLTDFVPIDGDYYVLDGTCGDTTLIKTNDTFADYWLLKSDDNTWHRLELIRLDGVTHTSLTPVATPPEGTKEYLPLIDLNSGVEWDIRVLTLVLPEIGSSYHLYVDRLITDPDKLGVLYLKASDDKYYGIRLRMAWADLMHTVADDSNSQIIVDQTETVQS